MRPISLPAQMQGSFFRGSPSRLSLSVCTSVSRRISLYQTANCSDSGSSKTINPKPPPPPPSSSSSDNLPDPALHSLVPLPSDARTERFRQDSGSSYGSFREEKFRSVGSRSEPSLPSIPGKFSKYSKPISKLHTEVSRQKAEKRDKKAFRKPMGDVAATPDRNLVSKDGASSSDRTAGESVQEQSKSSPSALEIPDWMQQYQFSYSEVPTVPIVGFRQTPWSPFGPPDLMERPWTGCAPLKPSKKKLPEFDSFNPPPRGKKGVKYVQPPGPFAAGQGPKPAKTREEILGAPLTELEIQELVAAVNKHNKQVNLGRDGLTHNMLDVIHSHWKRSVCCKIRSKGVPTLDMDNVARVVEAKTGGVIIHRAGGVMYVFRGRNYNYKDRPKIPIMLWKPPEPIYPRLIQPIPEGLTDTQAKQLRAKGRKVAPLCKLSKNGVYLTLVAEVRAQLEVDEVVKVDCQGMNATDYKKIGAKLKDLVPCTLLSFEKEQIVVCRKRPAKVENDQQTPGIEQGNAAASMAEVQDVQQTHEIEQVSDTSIAEEVLNVQQSQEVEQAIDASVAEVQNVQRTEEVKRAIDTSMAEVQNVQQAHEVEQVIDASIAEEVLNVQQSQEVEQAIDASVAEVQNVQRTEEVKRAIDTSMAEVQNVQQAHEVEQVIDASIAEEVLNVQQSQEVEQAIDASVAEVQNVQQTEEVKRAIDTSMAEVQNVLQAHEVEQVIDASIAEEVLNVQQSQEVKQAIDASVAEVQNVQRTQELEQAIDASIDTNPQDRSLFYARNCGGSGLDMGRNRNSAVLGTDESTTDQILTSNGLTGDPTSVTETASSLKTYTDDVEALWQQAIEEGQALQLDNEITDPDVLFEKAAKLSSTIDEPASEDSGVANEVVESEKTAQQNEVGPQISSTSPFNVPPMGGLAVDELAKLLKP